MDVWDAWEAHDGHYVFKIDTYPDAQHAHLQRFQGKPVTLLEIGVHAGGSLELWQRYLGDQATIVGADIDPNAGAGLDSRFRIFTGDQADRDFLARMADEIGPIDIVIDDGGHTMVQQCTTFEVLFPLVAADGVYLCEDTCTSYWPDFGGGVGNPGTFVEFAKAKVDELNAFFSVEDSLQPTDFTRSAASVHFYSGVIAFEKRPRGRPRAMGSVGAGVAYQDLPEGVPLERREPRTR